MPNSELPYVASPGTIKRALDKIRDASTPTAVNQDFVKATLGIKGGQGNQITSYLRKIGFASSSGEPTEIYKKFRNPATTSWAALEALRLGYGPLKAHNENFHAIGDEKLRGLITEVTGAGSDSRVPDLVFSCIKQLKGYIKESSTHAAETSDPQNKLAPKSATQNGDAPRHSRAVGLNLGYTINLNLPATADAAVFHAIFTALREELLRPDSTGE